jgi:hypothetical protein
MHIRIFAHTADCVPRPTRIHRLTQILFSKPEVPSTELARSILFSSARDCYLDFLVLARLILLCFVTAAVVSVDLPLDVL